VRVRVFAHVRVRVPMAFLASGKIARVPKFMYTHIHTRIKFPLPRLLHVYTATAIALASTKQSWVGTSKLDKTENGKVKAKVDAEGDGGEEGGGDWGGVENLHGNRARPLSAPVARVVSVDVTKRAVCMYVCIHMYMYVYTYVCICTYIYTCICFFQMYIYIYIHVYVYMIVARRALRTRRKSQTHEST